MIKARPPRYKVGDVVYRRTEFNTWCLCKGPMGEAGRATAPCKNCSGPFEVVSMLDKQQCSTGVMVTVRRGSVSHTVDSLHWIKGRAKR